VGGAGDDLLVGGSTHHDQDTVGRTRLLFGSDQGIWQSAGEADDELNNLANSQDQNESELSGHIKVKKLTSG
jgi:hypothetical protein